MSQWKRKSVYTYSGKKEHKKDKKHYMYLKRPRGTWRHTPNRKYITYCTVVGGGPIHVTDICTENFVKIVHVFLWHLRADKQTDSQTYRQTYIQTDTLIAIAYTSNRVCIGLPPKLPKLVLVCIANLLKCQHAVVNVQHCGLIHGF